MVLLFPTNVKSIKISAMKLDINPYMNKEYFEKRHKILDVEGFRKKIYDKHNHRCAACGEILNSTEQVDLHHIIPKSKGGTYSLKNIVPLHKTCHESVSYARKVWFNKNLRGDIGSRRKPS